MRHSTYLYIIMLDLVAGIYNAFSCTAKTCQPATDLYKDLGLNVYLDTSLRGRLLQVVRRD
jgi:hypothetical protein